MLLAPFVQAVTASQQGAAVALVPQSEVSPKTAAESIVLGIVGDGAVGMACGYLLSGEATFLHLYPGALSSPTNRLTPVPRAELPQAVEFIDREELTSRLLPLKFEDIIASELDSLRRCHAVILAVPCTEYGAAINSLKKYLMSGQTILLPNASLGAGLQFQNELRKAKLDHQLNILELGTLFDCARVEGSILKVRGVRKKISICGNTRNDTHKAQSVTRFLSKSLVPSSNVLERGFIDLEKALRPILLLFGLLGGTMSDFSHLSDVVNPRVMDIVRAVEAEMRAICKPYRLNTKDFLETLTELSAVHWEDADCLEQALIAVGPTLVAQTKCDPLQMQTIGSDRAAQLLTQDVTETLTLIEDLARTARVHTPVLSSIIDLSSIVTHNDLRKTGRSVETLGWVGLDCAEITETINA